MPPRREFRIGQRRSLSATVARVIPPLSTSYADAQSAFLAAAAGANARVESFPHPLTGIDGEALAVDVAEVGPVDAENVVVVVSGTHGVEGYLGSALQRHHLESGRDPETVTVIFVHALNPYGFSWMRRVNEDNVDLNRNFIDWAQPLPENPGYADLASDLVPTSWSEDAQIQANTSLGAALAEMGLEQFQQVVSGGQYTHDTGVFYGGLGPTWSNRWLHSFVASHLAAAKRVAIIDLHTGLGPWSHGELISSAEPEGSTLKRQRAWWDGVTALHDGSSVSAEIAGDWLGSISTGIPNAEVTGIAIEYGTVDPITVLQSLRADAVLHGHGDPKGPEAEAIRNLVRAAFLDDDPAWLEACWPRYESVVGSAVDNLSAS